MIVPNTVSPSDARLRRKADPVYQPPPNTRSDLGGIARRTHQKRYLHCAKCLHLVCHVKRANRLRFCFQFSSIYIRDEMRRGLVYNFRIYIRK